MIISFVCDVERNLIADIQPVWEGLVLKEGHAFIYSYYY